jgi:NitT/TauT family transport system substrate-binding protein
MTFDRMFKHAAKSLALLGLLFAGISSAGAQQLTPLKLRLSWTPFGLHAAVYLAMERGWFRDGGVDLHVEDGSGSTSTVNLLGTGQYDIGEAAVASMAIARGKGMPLKSIANFIRGTEMGILVTKGSGIKTVKDLEGKKVAYTAGSLEGPFMEHLIKAGGASSSKIELLNVDFASKIPTYLSGKVDAVVTTVPFVLPLVTEKRPSDTVMFGDYGLVLPSIGYIATEETIRAKPKHLQTFVSAMSRAWQEILENDKTRDEALDLMVKHRPQANVNLREARGQIEAYRAFFSTKTTVGTPQGWNSPEDWKQAVAGMVNAGLLPVNSKAETFFTNQFFAK